MFNKKELTDLKTEVETVKASLASLQEKQNQLTGLLSTLQTGVEQIQATQLESVRQANLSDRSLFQEVEAVAKSRQELESSLRAFKELQNKLETHAFEKINEGIQRAIETLKKEVEAYGSLKLETGKLNERLLGLGSEINKFLTISKNITEADYEFKNYVKTLTANDQEKLRLMQEIDQLQRLVGALRRKTNEAPQRRERFS